MPRDLQVGDRVKTPVGLGVVTRFACGHAGEHSHVTLDGEAHQTIFYTEALEPLPRDIPRERVKMLHAAVAKRVEVLRDEHFADGRWIDWEMELVHCELSEVAEALRVLLEGEVRDV